MLTKKMHLNKTTEFTELIIDNRGSCTNRTCDCRVAALLAMTAKTPFVFASKAKQSCFIGLLQKVQPIVSQYSLWLIALPE